MSNEQGAQLPNPADAYQTLFDNVHARVFLNKLASFGIQPATEKEAADLFMLAGRLRNVDGAEKTAAESSRFSGAVETLDSMVNSTPAAQHSAIKQAAAALADDPAIFNAVLSLQAAEAALLAGEQ